MANRQGKQNLVAGVAGVSVLGLLGVLGWMISSGQQQSQVRVAAQTGVDTTTINNRSKGVGPELEWVELGRERMTKLEQSNTELQKSIKVLPIEYAKKLAAKDKQLEQISAGYERVIAELSQRLDALETGTRVQQPIAQQGAGTSGSPQTRTVNEAVQQRIGNGDFIAPVSQSNGKRTTTGQGTQATPSARVKDTSFSKRFTLSNKGNKKKTSIDVYELGSYLPAGSYAPAVVISGVDASTGVTSQGSPKPVLFRILGPATTAGYGTRNGAKIDLVGCVVSGAATGDLSSERVYVRLTGMTCQNADQTVFETKVAGHMVSSGKTGLRGEVVSREGPSIRAAGVAGFLEGISGGISSVSGGVQNGISSDTATDIASLGQSAGISSLTSGVQGAAGKLAQYYIDKAEQYQPVISMYSGSNVELVFMEGVHLQ